MRLIKNFVGSIPTGTPGTPYIPAQPAWTERVCTSRTIVTPIDLSNANGSTMVPGTAIGFYVIGNTVYVSSQVLDCSYITHPASLAIAGIPAIPPTQADWDVYNAIGWNSWARSIDELVVGGYLQFTVLPASRAAVLAVDGIGMEGQSIAAFAHGILIDADGIHVFENGVATTLQSDRNAVIWIYRLSDGRIVYATNQGAFHVSAVTPNLAQPLYVYGLLYAAGDEVDTTAFLTGTFYTDTQANMGGFGTLEAFTLSRVSMSGIGSLLAVSGAAGEVTALMYGTGLLAANGALDKLPEAAMSGVGYLYALAETGGIGSSDLPLLFGIGSDYAYGAGIGTLPALTSQGDGGFYVPAVLADGWGILPLLSGQALGSDDDAATGSVTLPLLSGIGADYAYGFGSANLPLLLSSGSFGGFVPNDEMWLMSGAAVVDNFTALSDVFLVLDSTGTFVSAFSMTRELALSLMSNLTGTGLYSVSGIFGMTLNSVLNGLSLQMLTMGTQAALFNNGVVWVVNMETKASSQYEQYGFNSFFQRGGSYYGVAGNGIYKLEGADDAGNDINALVMLVRTNMGILNRKRVDSVYVGMSSTDDMILKVEVDGMVNYYQARGHTEDDIKNHRFIQGKGQMGNYWQFTLLNKDGCEFALANMEFVPIILERRI